MSVMVFGAEELGNLAAACLSGMEWEYVDRPSERIRRVCENLSTISTANALCFNKRYSHHNTNAKECTAKDIEKHIPVENPGDFEFSPDLRAAVTTARLLEYNCIDGDINGLAVVDGAYEALTDILEGLMITCAKAAGLDS